MIAAAERFESAAGGGDEAVRASAYQKASWRLLPFLFACYVANYIDRTNVGIAQVQLKSALGFSEGVYGLGVGLFFIGFILFETPSNLLLGRIGVRLTLLRIMVLWSLASAATILVRTPLQFYAARFVLGLAEAGFFPGVLLFLTYWFPSSRRARITSAFLLAIPVSALIGLPLAGWILHAMNGVAGLAGWQWMFLIEAAPSAALGVGALFLLEDRPEAARWLTSQEKAAIAADLKREQTGEPAPRGATLAAFANPQVYLLGVVAFGSYTLANAVAYWTPLIINASGVKRVLNIGLLSAIPPLFGLVVMVLVGRSSDRLLERRWHAAGVWGAAALALGTLSVLYHNPLVVVASLAVATAGFYSGMTVFWTIPSAVLSKEGSAAGIALVSSIGALGAAVSPVLLGWIKVHTGNLSLGLQITAVIVALGGVILLIGVPASALKSAEAKKPR